MAEGPRRRLQLVSILLIGLVVVLVAQLVQVQVIKHDFYEDWAAEQRNRPIAVADPPRGVVRDRNGHLLAGNRVMYSIEADTVMVLDAAAVASVLGPELHLPIYHVERLLSSEALWVQIAPSVSKEVGERIADLGIPGITVRPLWAREYPEGQLASHVLGFCNAEGRGYYGVEGFHDVLLRPEKAESEGPVDPSERVPWTLPPDVLPQPGVELILTIDRTVQTLVEEELARSVQAYQADGGTIIVMDPRTFEILAMASLPDYDPNHYYDFYNLDPLPFDDPAVSHQYEPGSVFKVLTVAAALDAGLVTPSTTYFDQGWIEVGGALISNAFFDQANREHTVADILIHSLNVGAAWLSTQLGTDVFYRYVQAFGIGRPTGVDLAGEAAGQLWLPTDYEHWHDSNLGTNSFGQGLAVTPIQMITAVATVANDGVRLRPHIVAQRTAPDGTIFRFQPLVEAQVVSRQTARAVMEMMIQAVEEGVPRARIDGYRVAGKSGTAQIPVPGGYDKESTITSFVGFGPVPDPQLIILVKLDRPRTSSWASDTAAPTFQRLASRLFVVMDLPPSSMAVAEAVTQ